MAQQGYPSQGGSGAAGVPNSSPHQNFSGPTATRGPHAPPSRGMISHPSGAYHPSVQHHHHHPRMMVVGPPRQMPPNANRARHHAPSPGFPQRMQLPPNAMRPVPQYAGHMAQQQQQQEQMQMPPNYHQVGPPPPPPPDERATAAPRESPSPPPVPPSHANARASPASLPDSEGNSMNSSSNTAGSRGEFEHYNHYPQQQQQQPQHQVRTPTLWNHGHPLRESRLQNVPPQSHFMGQMHPHHHHHHPQAYPQRFQAMPQPHPKGMGNMKMIPRMHPHHPHPHAMMSPQQIQQRQQQVQAQQQQQKQPGKKVGPDVTMDAASVLLALRTSASPATVSQATLEEQQSKDQADDNSKVLPMTVSESQDKEDQDDDVPELQSSSSSMSAPKSCAVGHEDDEQPPVVPKNFPTRLALPNDEAKLNSLHCFLRSELLEIFVVERSQNKSPTHSPGSSVGRVGLRCVFCAMARQRNQVSTTDDSVSTPLQNRCDEAPMAVFYPKSIAEIYRLVTSWQRCHLRKCRNLPPDVRSKWQLLRENDKSRGKTHYWITSAREIGLVDCQSRAGGIRFASPRNADHESVSEGLNALRSHEDDSIANNVYRPYSIPNFKEGPSQKQREAHADANATPVSSSVDTPLKEEKVSSQPASKESTTSPSSNDSLVLATATANGSSVQQSPAPVGC